MSKDIPHMISAERKHRKWVAANGSNLEVKSGCSDFRSRDGTHENAVVPIESLDHERDCRRAPAAEQECIDGNSGRVFPIGGNGGTLSRGGRKSGIRMSGRRLGFVAFILNPGFSGPVDDFAGRVVADAFPPNIAVFGEATLRENGLFQRNAWRIRFETVDVPERLRRSRLPIAMAENLP